MPIFRELITLSSELVAAVQRARPRAPRAAARRGVHAQRRRRRARSRGVPRGGIGPVRDRRVRLRGDRPGDLRRHRRARLPLPADRAARRPRPLPRHARDGHLGAAGRPLADRAPPRHDRRRLSPATGRILSPPACWAVARGFSLSPGVRGTGTALTASADGPACAVPAVPEPARSGRRGRVVGSRRTRESSRNCARTHEGFLPEGDTSRRKLQLSVHRRKATAWPFLPAVEIERFSRRRLAVLVGGLARLLALEAHPLAVRRPAGAQGHWDHRDAAGGADGRVVVHPGSMSPTDERGTHGTAPALT